MGYDFLCIETQSRVPIQPPCVRFFVDVCIESGPIVPNGSVYVLERAVTPSHRQQNPYIDRLCDAWLVFVRRLECHPDVAFLTQLLQKPSEVDMFSRMEPALRLYDLLRFVLKPLVRRILM